MSLARNSGVLLLLTVCSSFRTPVVPRMALGGKAAAAGMQRAFEVSPKGLASAARGAAASARGACSVATLRVAREFVQPLELGALALAYYLTHDELLMRFVFAAQEAARAAAAQPLKSKERAARAQRQPGARPYSRSLAAALGPSLRLLGSVVWPALYALDVAIAFLRRRGQLRDLAQANGLVRGATSGAYYLLLGHLALALLNWWRAERLKATPSRSLRDFFDLLRSVAMYVVVALGIFELLALEGGLSFSYSLFGQARRVVKLTVA